MIQPVIAQNWHLVKKGLNMLFSDKHKWNVFEDIEVAVCAVARCDDPKSVRKLAKRLGIRESQVLARMNNYIKLLHGGNPDWHYSKQEKKVWEWLNDKKRPIRIVPTL